MSGKILNWLLATGLLTTVSAEAQQPKKVFRIKGIYRRPIQLLSPPAPRQLGWLCARVGAMEGQNIATEYRNAEGKRIAPNAYG